MNCEKCKNKKATLFFADESGRRHALCAACGQALGRAIGGSPEEKALPYLPSPTLTHLNRESRLTEILIPPDAHAVCRGCGVSLEDVAKTGEMGCPECYECFGNLLFPALPTKSSLYSARMPSARRKRLERERKLTELRVELRRAVDSECFELAATLRDKIKELEKQH